VRAFTIIELLVVLGITGLLIGVGLPVLNQALQTGKKAQELSGIKNLAIAHISYTTDNNGIFIKSYDKNGTARDLNGNNIGGEDSHEAHRWPWRLAPYFNYDFFSCSHLNSIQKYIKSQGGLSQTYLISVIPSFGLNIIVGGNDYENIDSNKVYTHINQVSKPSKIILFASSRSWAGGQKFEGFYYINEPKLKKYIKDINPRSTGFLSARYNGQVVVVYLNGAAGIEYYEALDNTKFIVDK